MSSYICKDCKNNNHGWCTECKQQVNSLKQLTSCEYNPQLVTLGGDLTPHDIQRSKDIDQYSTIYKYRELEVCGWKNSIVKHFKGDYYLVIDIAQHTETDEKMIIYRALYGDCTLYVRPMSMFIEKCNEEQFSKYRQDYRFELANIPSIKK